MRETSEIKFRAWDGHGMRYWGFMEIGKCGYAFYGPPSNTYGNPMTMTHMQFTGTKDKNGKEIYEGDILRYQGLPPEPRETIVSVVTWRESPPGFFVDRISGDGFASATVAPEVIGNIYENGDLLEEK